jgi:DNA-binding MarR family transcriptional regulator
MGSSTPPPLIGALLRHPLQIVRERIIAALADAGYDDVVMAHLNVFQYPPPRGVRPTDLARRVGISKQAMNHLLEQLENLDYLERRPGGSDGRAREVWLTERGEAAVRVIRRAVQQVEAEWRARLGSRRYAALREGLALLQAD